MKISFHGADHGVTGSCHLVECSGKKIRIDCGLHQGSRETIEENREPCRASPSICTIPRFICRNWRTNSTCEVAVFELTPPSPGSSGPWAGPTNLGGFRFTAP